MMKSTQAVISSVLLVGICMTSASATAPRKPAPNIMICVQCIQNG
jgi:hypothetical protein